MICAHGYAYGRCPRRGCSASFWPLRIQPYITYCRMRHVRADRVTARLADLKRQNRARARRNHEAE